MAPSQDAAFDDEEIPAWLLIVTSWPAVYTVMLLPLILMGANFVFGRCGVAEALETAQDKPPVEDERGVRAWRKRHIRRGRLSLLGVCVAFSWQLHCLWRLAEIEGTPENEWKQLLLPSLLFIVAFTRSVLARPSSQRAIATGLEVSTCSKCGARVPGMDHHCFWIHNCVGAHNRGSFVGALAGASWASLSAILAGWGAFSEYADKWLIVARNVPATASHLVATAAEEPMSATAAAVATWLDKEAISVLWSAEVIAGWLLAVLVFVGTGYLLAVQVYLLLTGQTTLGRIKAASRRKLRRHATDGAAATAGKVPGAVPPTNLGGN